MMRVIDINVINVQKQLQCLHGVLLSHFWAPTFLNRGLLLTRKLLDQGFLVVKLKSSLRKFYVRHLGNR